MLNNKLFHRQSTSYMPNMVLGTKNTKIDKIWSEPVKVQCPMSLKMDKTGRRETNYGATK